jgi:transcriptional regulator GlxA family with amidase domain
MHRSPPPSEHRHQRVVEGKHPVIIVASPDVQLLDIAGPCEVFSCAVRLLKAQGKGRSGAYPVPVATTRTSRSVTTTCGLEVASHRRIDRLRGEIDTLLIASCQDIWRAAHDQTFLRWLRRTALRVRRIGALRTGTFLLAEAGLLTGHRVTTSWQWGDDMARRHAVRDQEGPKEEAL